ncbi:haloacid dehalogenase type II [Roseicitreum antarcticum]|uniref:(S)-2-haloacid dehalogenase n=1 Tax=Roseicitreum antarcticum TaxID=564137 RepID=A0A1H2TIK6_9RHOB|nr:haloacid dehalogenase type II [Roseicitreum antarcticum]SDW43678.1 2-haloacid dehalogenase [Roseicitreum antarcticum]
MPIRLCVFDAYGTLFDVAAAARAAAKEPGAEGWAARWPSLSAHWRRKQLEYTWLRAVAVTHVDFWQVTQDALDWALEAEGLNDPALRGRLLDLYHELAAFPEVPGVLDALKGQGLQLAILSNGAPQMLDAAARSAGISPLFDAILSVEDVGVFKPHRSVYELVGRQFGTMPAEVAFVSSNCWDACAAAAFGFHAIWINREGAPIDRLFGRPAHVLHDLDALPALLAEG